MMSGTKLMTPPTPSMMPESTSDLSWPVGEHGVRAFAQQGKPLFHPAHRDLPNGEGNGIKQIEHAEHDRRAHERMRQHLVHAVRELDARVHILKPDQHAIRSSEEMNP